MATWDDVRDVTTTLPETEERSENEGLLSWRVKNKTFAWERPLRKADLKELGSAAPEGPVLAGYVQDFGAKTALLAEDPDVYFATSHFDNYPMVLARLDQIDRPQLEEFLVEAWLNRAPKTLVKHYLDAQASS